MLNEHVAVSDTYSSSDTVRFSVTSRFLRYHRRRSYIASPISQKKSIWNYFESVMNVVNDDSSMTIRQWRFVIFLIKFPKFTFWIFIWLVEYLIQRILVCYFIWRFSQNVKIFKMMTLFWNQAICHFWTHNFISVALTPKVPI